MVPWPISARTMRTTTASSGFTTTHTPSSGVERAVCALALSGANGIPIANPPPAAAVPIRKERRSIFGMKFMTVPLRVRSHVDRFADLLEGATATDIGDRVVDVLVGRLRLLGEQRRDRHDHSALTVAALRHIVSDPGLLHLGKHAALREALDGGDLLAGRVADLHRAGADRLPVDGNGARAARRDAATIFCPGQADLFADHPQEGWGR